MHFTYREPDQTVLRQGDVLLPTPDLIELLRQYHPHYAQGHYTHYQVLTQSCDLVLGRRQQYCKARYITLAAVRNIDVAINRELDDRAKELIEFQGTRFASSEAQYSMRSFMDRLLNNNEPSYFFLRACPERGIAEDSCTFLRLSIAIKSDDHYKLCASAKTLELSESFQAKLGWLVGNLYSRVGTEDFAPGANMPEGEFDAYIEELLSEYVAWVPQSKFSTFRKLARNHRGNISDLYATLDRQVERQRASRLGTLVALVDGVLQLTAEDKTRLRNVLAQDPSLSAYLDRT